MTQKKDSPAGNSQPSKKPKQRRVGLDVPKDLEAIYANAAMIANTPAELVIDFIQLLPRMQKGKVNGRVIMSPMHAKLFLKALAQNIANYERQYGEIRTHYPNLADEFFKMNPRDKDDKDGKDD